jgi:hypothetical protein
MDVRRLTAHHAEVRCQQGLVQALHFSFTCCTVYAMRLSGLPGHVFCLPALSIHVEYDCKKRCLVSSVDDCRWSWQRRTSWCWQCFLL